MAYDVERSAGGWVREQARRHQRRVWLLGLGIVAAGAAIGVLGLRGETVLALGLFGAVLLIRPLVERQGDVAIRWSKGAEAERCVGELLEQLRREGFVVMHDLVQGGEGNIDHLVSGPSGVFLVETKWRRYDETHLRKAKRQAAKLARSLDVWVTPVVALSQRRPRRPYLDHGVWIVTASDLLDWIRARRNAAVDFERLASFADRL